MGLKAVLFDYGDTLISTRMNWDRVLRENLKGLTATLEAHVPDLDPDRLQRDFAYLRHEAKQTADKTCVDTPAVECLRSALALQGRQGLTEEILQVGVDGYFAAEEANYSIIVGVPETLQKLKGLDLRLGVVSNATCGKLVRRALQRRRLLSAFDCVVISAEVGVAKPDPAIFQRALSQLDVAPDQAVMVGDRIDTDVAGAAAAGIRAVLTDFFGEEKQAVDGPPWPEVVVRHPEALVKIFESWIRA